MNLNKGFFNSNYFELYISACLFIFIFFLWYPTNVIIADEISYLNQGRVIVHQIEKSNYNLQQEWLYDKTYGGQYPHGTAILIALLLYLGGQGGVFILGTSTLLASLFFIGKTLVKCNLPSSFALLLFIFFPTIILSRTLMSDLPSLLIISLFTFFLFKDNRNKQISNFILGFLCTFSILFREPNILLLLPFVIGISLRNNSYHNSLLFTGLCLGLIPRLLSAYWYFGDAFFSKDPGISFTLGAFGSNLIFYAPFLFILIPLGGWAAYNYDQKYTKELKIALLLFIGTYLFYGYNGIAASGIKAIILGPRFLIPTLPLFIICVAYYFSKSKILNRLLLPVSLLLICLFQYLGHFYNYSQDSIFKALTKGDPKVHLIGDVNTLSKIYNPHGVGIKKLYHSNVLEINTILERDTFLYFETAIREDTDKAKLNSLTDNNETAQLLRNYHLDEVYQGKLPDQTVITQYKVQLKR